MTALRAGVAVAVPGHLGPDTGHPGVTEIVHRLRAAADEMVAFSRTKTLMREAAMTIERLDADTRHHAADAARLTAELSRSRATPRGE
jgi:hypothetical protein